MSGNPTEDARWNYMDGQLRPTHPALLDRFAADSAAAVAQHRPDLDLAYGPHPRMVFDGFRATTPWRGTLLWFHAGYWQSRDKATFRFLAPPLLALGLDVALVNYPLCPEVSLAELLAATRDAVPAVAAWSGHSGAGLIAAGHSAGGHIAAELALAGLPLAAVAAFSGIYDLAPLVATPLNDRLRLDAETARALSPLHRLRPGLPPAVFAVGSAETPAFLAQNAAMATAWGAPCHVELGADHFSLLDAVPAILRPLLERIAPDP